MRARPIPSSTAGWSFPPRRATRLRRSAMDSVTQMLFGATVAQAGFRRRLGRKAMLAGAIIASLPDLDVAVGWVAGPFENWVQHRGMTHSLLFGPIAGPAIGWIAWRLHRLATRDGPEAMAPGTLRAWIWLAILALITHPLIDLFTSYGTQLLWPLTSTRFAIDSMPIIDPFYSGILAIALAVGARARARPVFAQDAAGVALLLITIYTAAGWAINAHVVRVAAADLGRPAQVDAYPLLLQPYYRRVLAITPEAAHVGYYSVLNPRPIDWRRYPIEATPAITAARGTREAGLFDWFAMDRVLWRSVGGGTAIEGTDLRYGMPGATDTGFWGVRFPVDAATGRIGPAAVFSNPREVNGAVLGQFWHDLTGR